MRAKPLAALTFVMVSFLAGLYAAHPWLLARYWDNRLSDPAAGDGLRQLELARAMGDSATRLLARTVGDHRSELAAKARRALLAEVEEARLDPTPTAAARLICVSASLAAESSGWDITTRAANAELATKILSVAGEHFTPDDREVLVTHCDTILRAAHQRRAELSVVAADAQRTAPGESPRTEETIQPPLAAASFDAPLAQFPGGGLPIDRAGPPVPSLAQPSDAPTSLRTGEGPGLSGNNLIAGPPNSAGTRDPDEPINLDDTGTAPLPLTAASPQLREMPRFQGGTRRVSVGATAAAIAVRDASHMAGRPTSPVIDVAQRLHSPATITQAGARAELRALGYSEAHVDLLRSVTDADPAKRAAAARALPVMRGMDARPWLLWLSFDDEEEVRHAALSVLATSYDPALVDRMRAAANTDPAPRVRRLAETYLTNMSGLAR